MSYGSRTDGLVQRRNVAASTTVTQEEEDDKPYEEEEEDHDSKETRLTLMEEVLLLGLKDREVIGTNIYATYLMFDIAFPKVLFVVIYFWKRLVNTKMSLGYG